MKIIVRQGSHRPSAISHQLETAQHFSSRESAHSVVSLMADG
jgi:hypothetical protein